jgi:hypothetical protein
MSRPYTMPKKCSSSSKVSSGRSSCRKWLQSRLRPVTVGAAFARQVARTCHTGPTVPFAPQRARTGATILLPARSSASRQRRSDVHETNFFDAFGKAETQSMGDASTPVVGTHKELIVAKMTHRLDLVQRHRAERVTDMANSVGRAARISVSSEIRYVDREPLGESRRHFVPGDTALWISMQKEYGGPSPL